LPEAEEDLVLTTPEVQAAAVVLVTVEEVMVAEEQQLPIQVQVAEEEI
jgi:hypothetical protein